jgi:hypothetical protein
MVQFLKTYKDSNGTIGFSVSILFIGFNAFSSIFPSGIDEIKDFLIVLIWLRFQISLLNIRLLNSEVIPAIEHRRDRLVGNFQTYSPCSYPWIKGLRENSRLQKKVIERKTTTSKYDR